VTIAGIRLSIGDIMNKKMIKNLFFTILLIAGFAGMYIGYFTDNKYERLQRGFLGGTVLTLLYHILFRSKDFNLNRPIEVQKDVIYIPVTLFLSILVYWAISDIINMIIYYF
jgi:hypothetical protein